jgi:hypothetical protein
MNTGPFLSLFSCKDGFSYHSFHLGGGGFLPLYTGKGDLILSSGNENLVGPIKQS